MDKICKICGKRKPLDQFPINRGMADGHLGRCFECFALRDKPVVVKPQEEAHPTKYQRKTKVTDEERRRKAAERKKRYYHAHKEAVLARQRAYQRKYYQEHIEEYRIKRMAYSEAHREELAEYRHEYYIKHKRNNNGSQM